MLHPLLARQLRRLGIDPDGLPHEDERWASLIERVNRSYIEADQERYLLERSLDLSSTEMRELNDNLRRSEERFRRLFEDAPLMYVITANSDGEAVVRDCNQRFLQQLDYERGQVLGRPLACFYGEQSRRELTEGGYQRALSGDFTTAERQLLARDGRIIETLLSALPEYDEQGRVVGTRAMFVDISGRKQAEEALRRSEVRFRSLVQNSSDIIAVFDESAVMQYVSPSVERLLGYTPDSLIGSTVGQLVHPDDVVRLSMALLRIRELPGRHDPIFMRMRHADGSWRWLESTPTNLLNDSDIRGIVHNVRDVTERHLMEEQLTHQANSDSLTGLPNRRLFLRLLTRALTERQGARRAAVLFLDLDNFKVINDSLGHPAGDALLLTVVSRLQNCLRPSDVVARFGGDEFAVLVPDTQGPEPVLRIAQRIGAALRAPCLLNGRRVVCTVSIGVAICSGLPASGEAEDLLRRADIALYAAKAAGKDQVSVFDEGMQAQALARLELETDLRHAAERGELVLHYQPEVNLRTETLSGVEALVRWMHPRRGLVAPGDFIPLAEETGMIAAIDRWVLREGCNSIQRWQAAHQGVNGVFWSFNVSPREFLNPSLAADVERTLAAAVVNPASICLEITESALMNDVDAAVRNLAGLRDLGIRLAIDDFGTGFSSLSYLHRFAVDLLKIDRSFVTAMVSDSGAAAIIRAITSLAHDLGMTITAEGIETPEQAAMARDLGCDLGQGYLFGAPLIPEALEAVFRFGLPSRRPAPTTIPRTAKTVRLKRPA